jgi:hypothetical protein
MSEQKQDLGHPSGLSPSDRGQSMEELEGSTKAFRRAPGDERIEHGGNKSRSEGVQAPGSDSRPDDTSTEGFVAAEDHPVMDDLGRGPDIVKEDLERLERQRVDQEDEIVAQYDPVTGGEKAVLRPRVSKKGAESEGI